MHTIADVTDDEATEMEDDRQESLLADRDAFTPFL